MKPRFSAICMFSMLLLATEGISESEYEIRARHVADHFKSTGRPASAGDVPANRPEAEELVYSDVRPASTSGSDVRFSVGTRILHVALLDDTQGRPNLDAFIGSINRLEVNQNYLPVHPYAQIATRMGPVDVGLGLAYDHLDVATRDDGGGDGDVEMDGWMPYLLAAWPNETPFTPFAELGAAFYRNRFDPISSWSEDGLREFDLDDSRAFYFGAGCDVRLTRNLSGNLYLRYVDVDVDGYYLYNDGVRYPKSFTFTLEHLACGGGLTYAF